MGIPVQVPNIHRVASMDHPTTTGQSGMVEINVIRQIHYTVLSNDVSGPVVCDFEWILAQQMYTFE